VGKICIKDLKHASLFLIIPHQGQNNRGGGLIIPLQGQNNRGGGLFILKSCSFRVMNSSIMKNEIMIFSIRYPSLNHVRSALTNYHKESINNK